MGTPGETRLGQVARMAGVAGLVSPLRTSVRGFRSSARRYADAAPTGIPYSKLNLGVPAETWTNEKRVACTPANTTLFTKKGFTVNIQEGAGRLSNFRDEDYAAAGGNIVSKEAECPASLMCSLPRLACPMMLSTRWTRSMRTGMTSTSRWSSAPTTQSTPPPRTTPTPSLPACPSSGYGNPLSLLL